MKEHTVREYLDALDKAHEDLESYKIIENLIYSHVDMIKHMKDTPLWDIFMYEKRLLEPVKIIATDNADLKKEVNQLRKKLGMIKKYKEPGDEE